jgi:cellobiose transport system permease protein
MTQDTVAVVEKPQKASPPAEPTKPIRRIAFGHRLSKWDVKLSPYLYVSPFFIAFAITGLFPLLYTAYVSVHEWHLIGGEGDFVGFDHFVFELTNEKFWVAVRNTLSIFIISAVPQIILALVIAAVLDANIRAKTFWRMGVLVPFIVTPVAVAIIFSLLFANDVGAINGFLTSSGLDKVLWHSEVLPSHIAIATMVNFRWTGYNALILLAAMQAVPRDYHEAAMIDGASAVRRFFSITIPSLRPTLIFVVITSTIGGLQIFDEPRMYDQYGTGGADYQWLTITMLIRNTGWDELNFGRAAAVAWLLFLLIVLIGVINLLITRRVANSSSVKVERKKR